MLVKPHCKCVITWPQQHKYADYYEGLICDQAYENRAYLHTNLCHFLNFNQMLLHTYLSYLNETFRTYFKIHEELYKTFRTCLSYTETK